MIRRLLADADLKGAIVAGVVRRNPDIDFKRAEEVPLEGQKDPEVLGVAVREGRVLVSHDVSTMPRNLRDMLSRVSSPGLVLTPQSLPVGEAIDSLLVICEALEPADLANRICLAPSLAIYGF